MERSESMQQKLAGRDGIAETEDPVGSTEGFAVDLCKADAQECLKNELVPNQFVCFTVVACFSTEVLLERIAGVEIVLFLMLPLSTLCLGSHHLQHHRHLKILTINTSLINFEERQFEYLQKLSILPASTDSCFVCARYRAQPLRHDTIIGQTLNNTCQETKKNKR